MECSKNTQESMRDLVKLYEWYRLTTRRTKLVISIIVFLITFKMASSLLQRGRHQQFGWSASSEGTLHGHPNSETYLPRVPILNFNPLEMASGWGTPGQGRQPKAECLGNMCPGKSDTYQITCSNEGLDETQNVMWKCQLKVVPRWGYDLDSSIVTCLQSQSQSGKGYVEEGSCYIVFSVWITGFPSILNFIIVVVALVLVFCWALKYSLCQFEPIGVSPTTAAANIAPPPENAKAEILKIAEKIWLLSAVLRCALLCLVILKSIEILYVLNPTLTQTSVINKIV